MANTLDKNQTTVNDGSEYVFGSVSRVLMGQAFQAGVSGPISRASISIFRAGSPSDSIRLKIYNANRSGDSISIPSATALITSTNTVLGSSLPSYPAPVSLANAPFVDFDFNGSASFVSGNYYLLSAERTGSANDTDRYGWSAASTNVDTTGGSAQGDTQTTWAISPTNISNVTNADQTYRTYYDPALEGGTGNFLAVF